MADFTIKRGDNVPILEATLSDQDGPINLTGATVKLIMKGKGTASGTTISGTCVIVSAAAGTVSYSWLTGNTDVVGSYDLEFQITYSGGGIETVPNDGYKSVEIVADLGD